MKISYNWLKQYININLPAIETGKLLTDVGLEVELIEPYETIKGNLEGVVIGQVLTCAKHPNADKLSVTTVNVGGDKPLDIVCGAPNVAAGQKVAVATVGTKLYFADGKDLTIKESKIRGEKSEGMICAEDELGLGSSHEGIIVLPEDAPIGKPLNQYWSKKIYSDEIFEIGLTPNRVDAASHMGTARDLVARLNMDGAEHTLLRPAIEEFDKLNIPSNGTITVEVADAALAPRYTGVEIKNITVAESPEWLQNKLKAIGLRPINNVVDITNYVLHETGQPLHAFDAAKIEGNKVIVKVANAGTKFTTLEGKERTLNGSELMIGNANTPMCIAGVMGGIESGVSNATNHIFIESAYFNPVSVRKTAKLHGLKTDSSFRFERGADPNMALYALKRAALLVLEVCGGEIASPVTDFYPTPVPNTQLTVSLQRLHNLIGKNIGVETITNILKGLEIQVVQTSDDTLDLTIPPFKTDVTREADIAEEILRIYGYNNIEIPTAVKSSVVYFGTNAKAKLQELVSNKLTSLGFFEGLSNSLTSARYHTLTSLTNPAEDVKMLNPLSNELDVMRQSLLFSALEAAQRNINYKSSNVRLYEFGRVYKLAEGKHSETEKLSLTVTGNAQPESWNQATRKTDFYSLKAYLEAIFGIFNIKPTTFKVEESTSDAFAYGLTYSVNNKEVIIAGELGGKLLKDFDIKQPLYYAEINWAELVKLAQNGKVTYSELPKYPEVRRDLALLVDKATQYAELERLAFVTEKKLLKNVNLFDVYEGKNLEEGKKSYALSFTLRDDEKTLTDEEIEGTMSKLLKVFEEKAGAKLR